MNIRSLTNADWFEALNNHEICPRELIGSLLYEGYEFIWHPLGFVMCRVARWESTSFRVHVWPNHKGYQQTPAWLIHDHLFHLKSWVLAGEIQNKEYVIDNNGKHHVIYEARYEDGNSILNKTNKLCSKKLINKSVYSKKSVYEVQSGTFHESQSLSGKTTVTVCETHDEIAAAPKVLGSVDGLFSYTYQRRSATNSEMRELVKKI